MLMAVTSTFLRRWRSHHGLQSPFWYFKRLNSEKVPRDRRIKRSRHMDGRLDFFATDGANIRPKERVFRYFEHSGVEKIPRGRREKEGFYICTHTSCSTLYAKLSLVVGAKRRKRHMFHQRIVFLTFHSRLESLRHDFKLSLLCTSDAMV